MAPKKTPPEIRFWAKVQKTDSCWLWTAAKDRGGYGVFGQIRAHHFLIGKAPEGLVWDHLCRVRHCVRPDHFEAVDPVENVNRGVQRRLKTHCAQGHPWTPENVRQGIRQQHCITCQRKASRAYYAANSEKRRRDARDYYAANRTTRLAYMKRYADRTRKPCETVGCGNPKAPGKGRHFCESCSVTD